MKLSKLLLALCVFALALAAQTVAPMPYARQQFFDANGKPLASGSIYTYVAGTSTPLATYTDATGSVANSNPVLLDASGSAQIWIGAAAYKFVAKTAAGVTVWTVDGVRDVALAGVGGVSVKTYGAKGDDVTDDSPAIAAACTAANGGQVIFPPAVYKITTGAINTCVAGTTVIGNGSTLDMTSLNGLAFGFNVGGSYSSSSPPTTMQGFKVLGTATNASGLFARADNLPGFTLRDIQLTGISAVQLYGQSDGATLDNVTVTTWPTSGYAVFTAKGTYAQVPAGVSIRRLACWFTNGVCVENQGGTLEISDIYSRAVATTVHANAAGGNVVGINLKGGTIQLENQGTNRGVLIDALQTTGVANAVSITGVRFIFADSSAGTSIAIDNNSSVASVLLASSFSQLQTLGTATLVRTSTTLTINTSGTNYSTVASTAPANVFDLPNSGSIVIASNVSGMNFYQLAQNQWVNFVKGGSSGGFTNTLISGNNFIRLTNFLTMAGTVITGNLFAWGTGSDAPPIMQLTGATLTNNYFSGNPAANISPKATNCGQNTGYACN